MGNTEGRHGRVLTFTGAGRGISREIACPTARPAASVVVKDRGGHRHSSEADPAIAHACTEETLATREQAVTHITTRGPVVYGRV